MGADGGGRTGTDGRTDGRTDVRMASLTPLWGARGVGGPRGWGIPLAGTRPLRRPYAAGWEGNTRGDKFGVHERGVEQDVITPGGVKGRVPRKRNTPLLSRPTTERAEPSHRAADVRRRLTRPRPSRPGASNDHTAELYGTNGSRGCSTYARTDGRAHWLAA